MPEDPSRPLEVPVQHRVQRVAAHAGRVDPCVEGHIVLVGHGPVHPSADVAPGRAAARPQCPKSPRVSGSSDRIAGMGIDWENMLGTSGNGLDEAYDRAVSSVVYGEISEDDHRPLPVGEESDDTDGLR